MSAVHVVVTSVFSGQFVSHDRAQRHTLSGVPGLMHQESREVTYMKGKKLIEGVIIEFHTHATPGVCVIRCRIYTVWYA